jgi:putative ABC transport system substrate-binding protein
MTALRLLLVIVATVGLLAGSPATAQPAGISRIGWLGNGSPRATAPPDLEAFRRGLRERGWIEGQTVTIESRWAEGTPDRLPALVGELVQLKVDVIVLSGTAAIRAAQSVTRTVPVVFVVLADPVAAGLVGSLARPGGNMTGVASQFETLITKQVELLKEAVPTLSRVAVLHRPELAPTMYTAVETATRQLGLAARFLKVADVADFEPAFRAARAESAGAIHVLPSPFFNAQRRRLIELAARYRLPAFYEFREYVEDGGLMSYGPSILEMFRSSASHVDRILKGARPGDLPIERPTTFELVINLKTAKALGLAIPPAVLGRADQVLD